MLLKDFTHYAYDGIYSGWDFHYCGTQGNDIRTRTIILEDDIYLSNCFVRGLE